MDYVRIQSVRHRPIKVIVAHFWKPVNERTCVFWWLQFVKDEALVTEPVRWQISWVRILNREDHHVALIEQSPIVGKIAVLSGAAVFHHPFRAESKVII